MENRGKYKQRKISENCGGSIDRFMRGYKRRINITDIPNMYDSILGRTMIQPNMVHVMVTLKGTLKGENG